MYARGGNVGLLHVCEGGQCRPTTCMRGGGQCRTTACMRGGQCRPTACMRGGGGNVGLLHVCEGGNVGLLHVCEGGQCRPTALAACMRSNVENQSCHPSTHVYTNEKQALGGFKSERIVRSL